MDPPDDPGAQGAPDLRPGRFRGGRLPQPDRVVVRPEVRRRHRAVREQPVPLPAAGGAGPARVRGLHPHRAHRPGGVPADRRPALHADPGRARLLLVRAVPAHRGAGRAGRRGDPGAAGCPRLQRGRRLPAGRRGGQRGRAAARPQRHADGCRRPARCSARPSGRNPMTTVGDLLREWMPHQRWFGGKGREWAGLTENGLFLDRGTPTVSVHRVRVDYADGGSETYLVPLSWRDHTLEELSSSFIGTVPYEGVEVYAYDAMRDRDATVPWLTHLVNASTVGPMHFHPAGVAYIPEGVPGDVISTEQSNTSLVYGESAILKLFRRLEPGLNPDVEIHDALRRTDNKHIAPLLGHIEIDDPAGGEPATVAMLQTFVPNASDGWRLATSSVRDLYAEGDLHADEMDNDFAGESERLGEATASVHADLAQVLPTEPADRDWYAAVAGQMTDRLEAALAVVPDLAEHADALRALYAAVADTTEPVVRQRVHGDLHLGQVLRTTAGWIVLDFEGEPARPLAARRELDTPLRDVAGMLRSFDYAARHMLVEQPGDPQRAYRAQEWAERNRAAFCEGYSAAAPEVTLSSGSPLLRAFEADKAVYECVYEARNRPHWLMIPLSSLSRLTSGD